MNKKRKEHHLFVEFWSIVNFNWRVQERAELRAAVEAWMAADKSAK